MAVIKCPECGKALKVSDSAAGKRVRCPGCKNPFDVPGDAPVLEVVEEEEEEQEERVTARPRPAAERRPKARRDDDEEEDRPRPRRRRSRDDRDDITASIAPLVYGILACLLSCAPLIGFIVGSLAMSKANAELDRLPGGKRARAARKQMQLAKTLGVVGMCLSVFMLVVAVVLNVLSRKG